MDVRTEWKDKQENGYVGRCGKDAYKEAVGRVQEGRVGGGCGEDVGRTYKRRLWGDCGREV